MTLNEKNLNYEVVDLVESYNFHIKFSTFIAHIKNYDFFKKIVLPLPSFDMAVGPNRHMIQGLWVSFAEPDLYF
jgi:hypothetical protein